MRADPLIGQEIVGCRILEELGRGGMGVVYKAEQVALGRIVAVKTIAQHVGLGAPLVRRFTAEARALARVSSPHITAIYNLDQEGESYFIVMEYVGGGSLRDRLERGPLPWAEARPLVLDALTALEHAHSVGVVHRDIKPGNLLLTEQGRVKVTDFGLAKLQAADPTATVTRGVAGTLHYMAPEQVAPEDILMGRPLDGRTDLYALGVTIYEMLAGRLPFETGGSDFGIMRVIAEEKFPPLLRFAKGVPPRLDAAVMRALEKDPADRYEDAAAMRAAFEAIPAERRQRGEKDRRGRARPHARAKRQAETLIEGASHTAHQPREPEGRPPVPWMRYALGSSLVLAVLTALALLAWSVVGRGTTGPALRIVTDPPGALVTLNGEAVGETPLELPTLDVREVRLQVTRAGYAPVDTFLVLDRERREEPLTLALARAPAATPPGALVVTSAPVGASVWIDGRERGPSPQRVEGAGPVTVRVVGAGYEVWQRTGVVRSGQTDTLHAVLQPVTVRETPRVAIEEPQQRDREQPLEPHPREPACDAEALLARVMALTASCASEPDSVRAACYAERDRLNDELGRCTQ